MNNRQLLVVLCVLNAAWPGVAFAQDMSAEDLERLEAAQAQVLMAQQFGDVVRYSIVAVYQRETNVSADPNWSALADVTDRVELQLQWQLSEGKLKGTPALQNHKATLANPRNPEKKCAPPKISGPFEYDLKKVEECLGGTVHLHIQANYPSVRVHQMCTGALKAVAAQQKNNVVELFIPPPTMLAMSLPQNGSVTGSTDGKSLIHKKDGWTWTFTPRGQQ